MKCVPSPDKVRVPLEAQVCQLGSFTAGVAKFSVINTRAKSARQATLIFATGSFVGETEAREIVGATGGVRSTVKERVFEAKLSFPTASCAFAERAWMVTVPLVPLAMVGETLNAYVVPLPTTDETVALLTETPD